MNGKATSLLQTLGRIHLYAGLFISPFVVLYAVTAVMFNHRLGEAGQVGEVTVKSEEIRISVDRSLENLPLALDILSQLGIQGEIDFIRRNDNSVSIPVSRPGEVDNVAVDLERSTAAVERRRTGFAAALLYLHSRPGPHVAGIRGNWFWIKAWRLLTDITVYLLLALTLSGPIIWLGLKKERRAGLALAGSGLALTVILVMALMG